MQDRIEIPRLTPHFRSRTAASRYLLANKCDGTLKRGMDILGALLLAVVFAPVLLVIAALVKLGDGGPVLFWQKRVGADGREFDFPKIRSMVVDAAAQKAGLQAKNQHGAESVTFKLADDPRITRVGRVIRKLSLDELPQLWCVLMGDMSLVGPRPPLPSEVERYSLYDRGRLGVVPGLTCTWQVSGRASIPFPQQVELDLEYIHERSAMMDVKILAQTVPAVVLARGAC